MQGVQVQLLVKKLRSQRLRAWHGLKNKTKNQTKQERKLCIEEYGCEIKYRKTKKKSTNLEFYIQQICSSKMKTGGKKNEDRLFHTSKNWGNSLPIHAPCKKKKKKKKNLLKKKFFRQKGKHTGQNLGSTLRKEEKKWRKKIKWFF